MQGVISTTTRMHIVCINKHMYTNTENVNRLEWCWGVCSLRYKIFRQMKPMSQTEVFSLTYWKLNGTSIPFWCILNCYGHIYTYIWCVLSPRTFQSYNIIAVAYTSSNKRRKVLTWNLRILWRSLHMYDLIWFSWLSSKKKKCMVFC